MMKKVTLFLFFLANAFLLNAQTTETFESATVGSSSFTNGQTFSLVPSSGFKVATLANAGYLSSQRFLESLSGNAVSVTSTNFTAKSLYLYPSTDGGNTNQTASVSVTFIGKLGGVQQFTYTPPAADFAAALWSNATNRGFSLVNFATPGFANTVIDELVIYIGGSGNYIAVDNFTFAAANLVAGDIAFTGYTSDNTLPAVDEFSFVIARVGGIANGTVISFTDNGWLSATSALNTNEGTITWTCSGAIAQGTQVKISANGIAYINNVVNGSCSSSGTFSLTTTGDQVLAYQGTSTSPTFIAGIHMNVATLAGDGFDSDAAVWDGTLSASTNRSARPPGLTTGSTAIWFTVEVDNARFNCSTLSGTASAIATTVNTTTNWDVDDVTPYSLPCVAAATSTTWNGTTWSNGAPTSTIDAIIASNIAPSTFTCKALTINSTFALNTTGITATVNGNITNNGTGISGTGTVVIAANSTISGTAFTFGGTLNLNAGTLTTGGLLRISPTGEITGNYSNISGSVTLQQSIIGQRGWRMFANPFTTTQTIATLASTNAIGISNTASPQSGLTDIRTFTNGTTAGWNNVTAATIPANTPYALFIRGLASEVNGLSYTGGPTAFTYNVTGTLNTSPFSVSPSAANFTLVGNPFAAPVNSSALTNGTGKSYYVYQITQGGNQTAQRTRAGGWSTVLSSSATSPIPNLGVIAYQAGSATSYNVTTSDINTTNAATTGLFSQEKAIENLALVIEQNGIQQDNLFVRQDAASTNKSTDSKDLEKLVNDNLNFYTINKEDNKRLAVDARNLNQATTTIPVGISAVQGSYTIKVGNNNIVHTTAMLRDKYQQTETTLTEATAYNFNITADAASKGEERFELVFNSTKPTVSTIDAPAINGAFTAKVLGNIATNNNITLQIQNAQTPVTITVTDIQGKVLRTQLGNNGTNKVQLNKANGMYIVSITDGKTVVTEKVIQ